MQRVELVSTVWPRGQVFLVGMYIHTSQCDVRSASQSDCAKELASGKNHLRSSRQANKSLPARVAGPRGRVDLPTRNFAKHCYIPIEVLFHVNMSYARQ